MPVTNLDRALAFTLRWEGGYVNDVNDPGGVTKYGISQRSFPDLDIKNLTLEEAKEIYRVKYWEAINGDARPFHEAVAIFDFAVNSGVHRALDMWAEAEDVDDYLAARIDFLTSLMSFHLFGRGWIRRVNDLAKLVGEEQRNLATSPDVELIQLYYRDRTFSFHPIKTTVGTTASGRTKFMARLG